jgi:hypothetical protein
MFMTRLNLLQSRHRDNRTAFHSDGEIPHLCGFVRQCPFARIALAKRRSLGLRTAARTR